MTAYLSLVSFSLVTHEVKAGHAMAELLEIRSWDKLDPDNYNH